MYRFWMNTIVAYRTINNLEWTTLINITVIILVDIIADFVFLRQKNKNILVFHSRILAYSSNYLVKFRLFFFKNNI